jgi:Helix-turn-helix domain
MMIAEQDRKDAFLQAMSDEFERKILSSTVQRTKSVEEISKENQIPMSTCYRRIRLLVDMKLLRIERTIITDSGKKYETFRSTVKDATIIFSSGEISVDVNLLPREPDERLTRMWDSIRGESAKIFSPVG